MKAKIEKADIRGHEVKENKKGEKYILVRFEDETGKPETLVDKDMERAKFYQRGTIMDLFIDIVSGRTREGQSYTNIKLIDAKVIGKE